MMSHLPILIFIERCFDFFICDIHSKNCWFLYKVINIEAMEATFHININKILKNYTSDTGIFYIINYK